MKRLLSVALVVLLPIFGLAQNPIRSIDSILDKLNRDDGFSGNVLISERGKIIYEKSFGFANYENRIPLTENTISAKLKNREDFFALRNTNYESEYGFGRFVAKDDSAGKIVFHPGGTIGFVSYFLRNITKDQCVIILTNNEMMRHYTPTGITRILNNQPYKLDNKSLAKALGKEYLRRGLESARKLFDKLKNDPNYGFREGEMNDLGYQLILDKNDAEAAIEILKINAEKFPESFSVWDSLGEIYYKAGKQEEAVKNYEKSLELNPQNEAGKRTLEKIRKEMTNP